MVFCPREASAPRPPRGAPPGLRPSASIRPPVPRPPARPFPASHRLPTSPPLPPASAHAPASPRFHASPLPAGPARPLSTHRPFPILALLLAAVLVIIAVPPAVAVPPDEDVMGPSLPPYVEGSCLATAHRTCQEVWNCVRALHASAPDLPLRLMATLGFRSDLRLVTPDELPLTPEQASYAFFGLATPEPISLSQAKAEGMGLYYVLYRCNAVRSLRDPLCSLFRDQYATQPHVIVPACLMPGSHLDPPTGLRPCDTFVGREGTTLCDCLAATGGDDARCRGFKSLCSYSVVRRNAMSDPAVPAAAEAAARAAASGDDLGFCRATGLCARSWPDTSLAAPGEDLEERAGETCAQELDYFALRTLALTPASSQHEDIASRLFGPCTGAQRRDCLANRTWLAGDFLFQSYVANLNALSQSPLVKCREQALHMIDAQDCGACWSETLTCYENVLGKQIPRTRSDQLTSGLVDGFMRQKFGALASFLDLGTAAGELGMTRSGWGDPVSAADFASRVFYGAFCISLCRMKGGGTSSAGSTGDASADWMRSWGQDDEVADLMVGHAAYSERSGGPESVYLNLVLGPDFARRGEDGRWGIDPARLERCPTYLLGQMRLPSPSAEGLEEQTQSGNYPWRVVLSRSTWVSCPHNIVLPSQGEEDDFQAYDSRERICATGVFRGKADYCYFSGKKPVGTAWKKGGFVNQAMSLVSGALFDSYDESAFKPRILQPLTVNPSDLRSSVFGVVLNCTGPLDEPVIATYAGAPRAQWSYDTGNDRFGPRHVWRLCRGEGCSEVRYVQDVVKIPGLEAEGFGGALATGILYGCSDWFDRERGVCSRVGYHTLPELAQPLTLAYEALTGCDERGPGCAVGDSVQEDLDPLLQFDAVEGESYPFIRPLSPKEQPLEMGPFTRVFDPEAMLDLVYDKEDFPLFGASGSDQECINLYTGGYTREGTGKLAGHLIGAGTDLANPVAFASLVSSALAGAPSGLADYYGRSDAPPDDAVRSVAEGLRSSMSDLMRRQGTSELLGPRSSTFGASISGEGRELATSLGSAGAHGDLVDGGVAEASRRLAPLVAAVVARTADDAEALARARLAEALLRDEAGQPLASPGAVERSVEERLGRDVAEGLLSLGHRLLLRDPHPILSRLDPPLEPSDRAWVVSAAPDPSAWESRLGTEGARRLRDALIVAARDAILSRGLSVLDENGLGQLHGSLVTEAGEELLSREQEASACQRSLAALAALGDPSSVAARVRRDLGDGAARELGALGARMLSAVGAEALTEAGRERFAAAAESLAVRELADNLDGGGSVSAVRARFGSEVADGLSRLLASGTPSSVASRLRGGGLAVLGPQRAAALASAEVALARSLADGTAEEPTLVDELVAAGLGRAAAAGCEAAGPRTAQAALAAARAPGVAVSGAASLPERLAALKRERLLGALLDAVGAEGIERLAADPRELEQRLRRLGAERRIEVVCDRLSSTDGMSAIVDILAEPVASAERLDMLRRSYQRQVFIHAQALAPSGGIPDEATWDDASAEVRAVFAAEVEERYVSRSVDGALEVIGAQMARDLEVNEQAVGDIVARRMNATGATALLAARMRTVVSGAFDEAFYALPPQFVEEARRLAEEIELAARKQAEEMTRAGLLGASDRPNLLSFSKAALIDSLVVARKPQIISGLASPLLLEGSQRAYGIDWTQGFFAYAASLWRIPGGGTPQSFADSSLARLPDATSQVCRDEGWERVAIRCIEPASCGPEAVRAGTPSAVLPRPPEQAVELLRRASRSPAHCSLECEGGNELVYANGTCPLFRHLNRKAHLAFLASSISDRRRYLQRLGDTLAALRSATQAQCRECDGVLDGLRSRWGSCQFAMDEDIWDALLRSGEGPASRDAAPIVGDLLATRRESELREGIADGLDYAGAVRLCTDLCLYWSARDAIGKRLVDGPLRSCPLLALSATCDGAVAVPSGSARDAAGVAVDPEGVASCVRDVLAAKESCTLLGMRLFTGRGTRTEGGVEVDDSGTDDPCAASRGLGELGAFLDAYLHHLDAFAGNVTSYLEGLRCLDSGENPERGSCSSCSAGASECASLLDASIDADIARLARVTRFGSPPMTQAEFVTRLIQLGMASAGDLDPEYSGAVSRLYRGTKEAYVVFDEEAVGDVASARPMNISLWWDAVHVPMAVVRNKVPFTLSPRLEVPEAEALGLVNRCVCPGGCFLAESHPGWAEKRCHDGSDADADANFYNDVIPEGAPGGPVDEDAECGELSASQVFPTPGAPPEPAGGGRLVNTALSRRWRSLLLDALARDLGMDASVPCAAACGRPRGSLAEERSFARCVRCERGTCDPDDRFPFQTASDLREFFINSAYPASVPMLCSARADAQDAAEGKYAALKGPLTELAAVSSDWIDRLFPSDPSCFDLAKGGDAALEGPLDCQEACESSKPPESVDELLYGFCKPRVLDEGVEGACACATITDPLGTGVSRIEASDRSAAPVPCRLPKPPDFYRALHRCCVLDHGCTGLVAFFHGDPDAFGCACSTGNIALDADQCIGSAEPRLVLHHAYFKVDGATGPSRAFLGERVRACAVVANEGGAPFSGRLVVEPVDRGGTPLWTAPSGCDQPPACTLLGTFTLTASNPSTLLDLSGGRRLELTFLGMGAGCKARLSTRAPDEGVARELEVPADRDDPCASAAASDDVLVSAYVPVGGCELASAVEARVLVQTHAGQCRTAYACADAPPADARPEPAGPCALSLATVVVQPGAVAAVCSAPVTVTESVIGSDQSGRVGAKVSAWQGERTVLSNITAEATLPLRRGGPGVESLAIYGEVSGGAVFPGSAVGVRATLRNNLPRPFSGTLRMTVSDRTGTSHLSETRSVPPIPAGGSMAMSSSTVRVEAEDVGATLLAALTIWDDSGIKLYEMEADPSHPLSTMAVLAPSLAVEDAFFREPEDDTRLAVARTCQSVRALVELRNPSPLAFAGRLEVSVFHAETGALLAASRNNAFHLAPGERATTLLSSGVLRVPSLGTYLVHLNATDARGVRWLAGNVDVADNPSARLRVLEADPGCELASASLAPAATEAVCPAGERTRSLEFTWCTGGGCLARRNGADGCYLLVRCGGCPEGFVPQVRSRPDGSCALANEACCTDCRVQVR